MPYATRTDMITRFTEREMVSLTDIADPHTGAVVDAVLDQALVDASAEIDGYLIGRYPLPLATPPALLTVFCCDIARYRLMSTEADERAKEAFDHAIAYLRDVALGKINLIHVSEVPAESGVGSVLFEPGTKVMGRDSYFGRGGE